MLRRKTINQGVKTALIIGFVHHQEMMGGLQGKTAITAYALELAQSVGLTATYPRTRLKSR